MAKLDRQAEEFSNSSSFLLLGKATKQTARVLYRAIKILQTDVGAALAEMQELFFAYFLEGE